uniref:Uncharacterized protein n=1 Tax=Romanomermis culicivorax TaxID=13658 RepID=A0A915IZV7_ROMCU
MKRWRTANTNPAKNFRRSRCASSPNIGYTAGLWYRCCSPGTVSNSTPDHTSAKNKFYIKRLKREKKEKQ